MIACAVASVLTGVLLGRGLPALNVWTSSERTRRNELVDSLTVLNAVISWRQSPEGRAASAAGRVAPSIDLVEIAPNRSTAEAKLMEMISDAADDAGLEITSLQIVSEPVTKRRSEVSQALMLPERVSLRASGIGDIDALTAFLSFADTSRSAVAIRSLAVTPRQQLGSQDAGRLLTLDVLVSALIHISAASAPVRGR